MVLCFSPLPLSFFILVESLHACIPVPFYPPGIHLPFFVSFTTPFLHGTLNITSNGAPPWKKINKKIKTSNGQT
ncbi:MAG: hypothetical protein BYD32DRAFT_411001 [Podila humilis]|nr:MAG: hypothetical protein BYD32DRAFT_411001 [Podila humilis]